MIAMSERISAQYIGLWFYAKKRSSVNVFCKCKIKRVQWRDLCI